jgi:hypothetical protein
MTSFAELEQIVKSLHKSSTPTLMGGRDNRKLLDALNVKPAADPLSAFEGISIFVEPFLPDDFILCASEDYLEVYQLKDGELKCFRVDPQFPLYPAWMHLVHKHRGTR